MKLRAQALALLVITSVSVLAGCSENPTGKPTPVPTQPSVPVTAKQGVPSTPPPIPRPLDASKFRDEPCDLFTDEQAQALGYPLEKRPGVLPEESYCMRDSMSDVMVDFSIWYRHDGTDWFATAYGRETGDWNTDSSVAITVEGQPALKWELSSSCRVLIGLSTVESIRVVFKDPKVDSCDRAVRIAEGVVRNVRG